jgi:hypothetical protein
LSVLGFELKALAFCSTTGAMLLTLLLLVIFQIGSFIFAWGQLGL